jgi:hypothetical protein
MKLLKSGIANLLVCALLTLAVANPLFASNGLGQSKSMSNPFEIVFANSWNRLVRLFKKPLTGGLNLGFLVIDGRTTKHPYYLPQIKRAEHMVLLGKTGSGKSFFLRNLCLQDIRAGRGFVYFDFHGDTIPFLLASIAAEEHRTGRDLSSKLILFEPANQFCSVGLNPLDTAGYNPFVQVVGITAILKERWALAQLGAQTEEILRNSLHVLADNHLTLLELSPLLSHSGFRSKLLKVVSNPEIRDYFENRFEPMSEAMKAQVRNPILNKVFEFCSDPHFRGILGQARSTFSPAEAMDSGAMILVDLNKGLLGKHVATLGSLIMAHLKQAIFSRKRREIYTLYCDEIQNLLTSDSDIDVLLSEARKFGVSIVSANQYLGQLPKTFYGAFQAVGTHVAFQLASDDSQSVAAMLGGGKPLAELLKNLPKRNFIAKSGHYPWAQVEVANVKPTVTDFGSLLERSRKHYARLRSEIEAEIHARRPQSKKTEQEELDEWE